MNKSYLKTKVYKESRSLSQSRVTLRNESFESNLVLHLDLQITKDVKESLIIKNENEIDKKISNLTKKHKLTKKQKNNLQEIVQEQWLKFQRQIEMEE